MEKLSLNRAHRFLRNNCTVFSMGGTVALRSVNIFFPENCSSALRSFYNFFFQRATVLRTNIKHKCKVILIVFFYKKYAT